MIRVKTIYGSLICRLAGRSSDIISLHTPTVGHLVATLAQRYDRAFGEVLYDPVSGETKPGMAILVNGRASAWDTELNEGDEVAFLLSFGGG